MNQDAFPLIGLQYVKGEPIDLSKEKGSHCVVVEMWATWCPPCRTTIPHLTEIAHRFPNVKFVGVTNEGQAAAKPFVEKMGNQMDYAVACDPTGVSQRYMQAFNLQGIPSAILVDKNGKMVWAGHPMDPGFEAAVKKADGEKTEPKVTDESEVIAQEMLIGGFLVFAIVGLSVGVAAYFYLKEKD